MLNNGVHEPPSRELVQYLLVTLFTTIEVQTDHGTTEAEEEDGEYQEEWKDILHRLDDELDVERGGIKHAQPVKHLGPEDEDDDGTDYASSFQRGPFPLRHAKEQHSKRGDVLEQICVIHPVGEVPSQLLTNVASIPVAFQLSSSPSYLCW